MQSAMTDLSPNQLPDPSQNLWSSTFHGTALPLNNASKIASDAKELLRQHEERGSPIWAKASLLGRDSSIQSADGTATHENDGMVSAAFHPLEDTDLANVVPGIMIRRYDAGRQEEDTALIRALISKDLSEPYGIYVYRYFLFSWPELTWMAVDRKTGALIGTIVCKLDRYPPTNTLRGYIAMIAVQTSHRKLGLGTILATRAMRSLQAAGADEVALETEEVNAAALKLYQKLGFLRTKHLKRYYLNGNDAFELVMYLNDKPAQADSGDGARDSGDDWDEDEY